jgi:hypothetical protein
MAHRWAPGAIAALAAVPLPVRVSLVQYFPKGLDKGCESVILAICSGMEKG